MASSNWANRSDACDLSTRRSLVWSPCTRCAAPIRALPSADCFPELGPPPWNPHFWDLLALSAGLAHWSLVRFDLAVQRRQTILPPAVMRYLRGMCMQRSAIFICNRRIVRNNIDMAIRAVSTVTPTAIALLEQKLLCQNMFSRLWIYVTVRKLVAG